MKFDVTFRNHPLDLPAGHYFFVPKVGLTDGAPAGADFLWLSAPKTIPAPADLQSWMRDDPGLAPDWLRIGTDIIDVTNKPAFNASFELSGQTVKSQADDLAPHSADNGPDVDVTPLTLAAAEVDRADVALAVGRDGRRH